MRAESSKEGAQVPKSVINLQEMEVATLSTEACDTGPAQTEVSPPDTGINSSLSVSIFSFLDKERKRDEEGHEELEASLFVSPTFPCKLQEKLPSTEALQERVAELERELKEARQTIALLQESQRHTDKSP